MMECAHCGRLFPEVVGAPTQVCPHCGHEVDAMHVDRAARPGPAIPVDPVGALTLAARVGAREYPRLLLLWLPALAVELAAAAIVVAYTRAAEIPEGDMTDGQLMQFLGVGMPLLLVFFSVRLATWSFVSWRVLHVALPHQPRLRARQLVAPALLSGFVLTLAYMGGIVLLLVGWLVVLHWFVYVPTFVARGLRLSAAFDESRRFAREHATFGFTALVALLLVAVGGAYLLLGTVLDGWLAEVVPPLLLWAVSPIAPLLAVSYVALALQGERAPSAGSDAAPLARTTTKCPQCGTLIPYAPSGSPVDVVCPACGRAGRIL